MRNKRRTCFISPGEVYGKYTAINKVRRNGQSENLWECIDSDGKIYYKRARDLIKAPIKGKLTNEELIARNEHQMGIRNRYFAEYEGNSKKRQIEFNMTFDEFNSLIVSDCSYCGNEPQYNERWTRIEHKKQPKLFLNGIDRIDSKKGYSRDNTVPCCAKCNLMKNIMSSEEFLSHVHKISSFNKKSSTTIPEGSTLK